MHTAVLLVRRLCTGPSCHKQALVLCVQVAILITRSWPAYPDMVAVGEAYAARRRPQPSIPALTALAGPFLPALSEEDQPVLLDPAAVGLLGAGPDV